MSKGVTKKEDASVAAAGMYEDIAGAGMEKMGADDRTVPFLTILQKLSPQVDETESAYIEGAKVNMICNTASESLHDGEQGVVVVPCFYVKQLLEWKPERQGLAGIHQFSDEMIAGLETDKRGNYMLENGNHLTPTAHYFCLQVLENGAVEHVAISLHSTGWKVARKWNTAISSIKLEGKDGPFTPPIFSHMYKLTVVQESNQHGNWGNWKVENAGLVTDEKLFAAAKKFYMDCTKGLVKTQDEKGEDIPF